MLYQGGGDFRWGYFRRVKFRQGKTSAPPNFGALGTVAGNFGAPKFWGTIDAQISKA